MTPADLSQAAHAIADACAWLADLRRQAEAICADLPAGDVVPDWGGEGTLFRERRK